jgi:hypothetical protein
MSAVARVRRACAAWFAAETHPANLAVARITVFAILLHRLETGPFGRYVRLPEEMRVVPRGLADVLRAVPVDEPSVALARALTVGFALLALVGLFTRPAAALATLFGVYVLGVPYLFGKIDHTLHHVVWFAALLAASPSGDALSLDAWLARRRGRPAPGPSRAYALPLRLMWLLIGVAYFFPGLHKLRAGPAWIFSDNLRFLLYRQWFMSGELPFLRPDLVPLLCWLAALGVIVFELSFLFLVLSPRTRPWAVAAGLGFHAATAYFLDIWFLELSACYVVFVDWYALARGIGLAQAPAAPARAQAGAAATAVVGALLLLVNVHCGLRKINSWPFSVYPTFDSIRTRPELSRIEVAREGAAGSRPVAVPLRGAQLWRMAGSGRAHPRERRLRALAEHLARGRDVLGEGEALRFYVVTWSTLPDDRGRPPLRRELLFDYHAARRDQPEAQP